MYFQQCVLVLFMSTLVPFEHDFTDNCFPFFEYHFESHIV